MTPISFDRSSTLTFKDFAVMASTDMFWEVRADFGCDYFTSELQAALRAWIKKEHFLIHDFWPERLHEKFAELLTDAADARGSIETLTQWVTRGSKDGDSEIRATMNWRSVLILLSRPGAEAPKGIDRGMLRDALALYKAHYDTPWEKARAFLKSIAKEWDCYPDSIAAGQKDFNISSKSDWDRKIYVECVLFYEMYVDVALGSPFGENCWQDFVTAYDEAFDDHQKQQFFDTAASHAIENKLVPYDGLPLPIEALRSPVPPVSSMT